MKKQKELLSKSEAILYFVFILLFIYYSLPIFTIAPIEGDGTGFANGATIMLQSKWGNNWAAYSFTTQSGTYALITVISKITGLTPLLTFSILSSICSLLFIILSGALVSKITSINFPVCGIVILLFQEAMTGGYYANTNVIASVFVISSLYLSWSSRGKLYETIIIGLLMGLASWIRFDAIIVSPAIFFLLYRSNWKESLKHLFIIYTVMILTSIIALYGSGSNFHSILGNAISVVGSQAIGTTDLGVPLIGGTVFKSLLAYFSALLIFLIILGIIMLIRTRKWVILGFVIFGIVPFYCIYSGAINTPKYMYYLIPFWGLLAIFGIIQVRRISEGRHKIFIFFVMSILSLQYLIGIQASFKSKPWFNGPDPTILSVFKFSMSKGPISNVSIVIGPGSLITTGEGDRLSSGLLFAPLYWSKEKRDLNAEISIVMSYLSNQKQNPIKIIADDYSATQLTTFLLLNNNYICTPNTNNLILCRKNTQIVHFYNFLNESRNFNQIKSELELIPFQKCLFMTGRTWKQFLVQTNRPDWSQLASFAYVVNKK